MKCSFCGLEFNEVEGQNACRGCVMAKGCHMIKCPNCGYDMPAEPKIIKMLKSWKERRNGTGRKV